MRKLPAILAIGIFFYIGIAFGKPYTGEPQAASLPQGPAYVAIPPSDPPAPPPATPDTPPPVPESPAPSPSPSSASQGPLTGSCAGDWHCFRECTIDHESRHAGVYTAVSGDGVYRGAYQYLASTWRAVATNAGHGEWAETPVDQVPPHIQDSVAEFHYSVAGNRPWGGRC